MARLISVGSGKGGTGKSMVIVNLAVLMARKGKRVCLVDMDVGGADAHILYGVLRPQATLSAFINREVESLEEVAQTLDSFHGLKLVAGTGETLRTANMPYQTKRRVLRHLRRLDADLVFIDVGAGTGYNSLDFFINADIHIGVTTPDPTAILDFYRFLKLSTIRKVLASFLAYEEISQVLSKKEIQSMEEVFTIAEGVDPGHRRRAESALAAFHPAMIINQAGDDLRTDRMKIQHIASKFLGVKLPELGHIPWDPAVRESIKAFMPVTEYAPHSPAAKAIEEIAHGVEKLLSEEGLNQPGDDPATGQGP